MKIPLFLSQWSGRAEVKTVSLAIIYIYRLSQECCVPAYEEVEVAGATAGVRPFTAGHPVV